MNFIFHSCIHDIAVVPVEISRELLGYFSSSQMKSIEILVAIIEETDPWVKEINLLWAALLEMVEEA